MQAYLFPSAFPDVRPALEALKGAPLAIHSNGSPRMLELAVRHNGLESYFAKIISADRVKTFKPSPRVYALGTEILTLPASDILFISSNSWDAAGAKAFGYKVGLLVQPIHDRNGVPWVRSRPRGTSARSNDSSRLEYSMFETASGGTSPALRGAAKEKCFPIA